MISLLGGLETVMRGAREVAGIMGTTVEALHAREPFSDTRDLGKRSDKIEIDLRRRRRRPFIRSRIYL